MAKRENVIVVMGVCGCGKTTVGQRLAERLGIPFLDADDFHPEANKEKMRNGIPLNDDDRQPWLETLAEQLRSHRPKGGVVLACSALKEAYRQILRSGAPDLHLVHLKGTKALITERMSRRKNHYMPTSLIDSQFATLEPPANAIEIDIAQPLSVVVDRVLQQIEGNVP